MDSKKLALLCRDLADNKKAENIVVLDVSKISSITDYFVIATGSSEPHLRAIINEITDGLREKLDLRPRAIDGSMQAWQVLDFLDVIVHVMRDDIRQNYDLETLWGDAPKVKVPKTRALKTPAATAKKPSQKPNLRRKKTPKPSALRDYPSVESQRWLLLCRRGVS